MTIGFAPTCCGFILCKMKGMEMHPGCILGTHLGIDLLEGFFLPLCFGGVGPSLDGFLFPDILIDRNPQDG